MPDHEPFDGTVPWVARRLGTWPEKQWVAARPEDFHARVFATWREAMNYATKEDRR